MFFGLLFRMLFEFDSVTGGFLSIILRLAIGVFICFFNSASLGIPGILGVFLGCGVLAARSGIPGIGVAPFCRIIAFGAFGSKLPDEELLNVTPGLAEMPGGMFAGALDELALLVLTFSTVWQAKPNVAAQENKIKKVFLNIK